MKKVVKTILKVMELMREKKEDEAKELISSLNIEETATCIGILCILKNSLEELENEVKKWKDLKKCDNLKK